MTDSSAVAITAVLLILIVMDVVGNTLVCLIIKRYLRTKYEKHSLLICFFLVRVFLSSALDHL